MSLSPHICCLCLNDGESGDHTITHCLLSRAIWNYFLDRLYISWIRSKNLLNLLNQWKWWFLDPVGKKFWVTILHRVCWGLWREWNGRIFFKNLNHYIEVVESIVFDVKSWASASPEFHHFSLNDFITD